MSSSSQITRRSHSGFTLVELLVSMAVLTLLIVLVSQLFTSATKVTTAGNKHMDADGQARNLLDRMAVDFAQMVKRSDVDYLFKQPANKMEGVGTGMNDQMAFYSEVSGYSSGSPSPVSLVAYRVNSDSTATTYLQCERMGKGLLWNGVNATDTPVVFLPIPLASPLPAPLPSPMPASAPTPAWPQAGNMTADPDYEPLGPQVFRMEYYYVLNDGTLSDTPWNTTTGSTSINGFRDVASIVMTIAVIDPKSRVLVSDAQLVTLAGQMKDFANTMKAGDLDKQWLEATTASALPPPSASSIRIYHRSFSITSPPHK